MAILPICFKIWLLWQRFLNDPKLTSGRSFTIIFYHFMKIWFRLAKWCDLGIIENI